MLLEAEGAGVGLNWASAALAGVSDNDDGEGQGGAVREFSLGSVMLMMALDCCVYMVLPAACAWCAKAAGALAAATASATCSVSWRLDLLYSRLGQSHESRSAAHQLGPQQPAAAYSGGGGVKKASAAATTADPSSPEALLLLDRIEKVYDNGVHAVRSLSLEVRRGEVLGLLGHNGAGKSTAVGMITGLVAPSSGDCLIAGSSVVTDKRAARRSLGLCLQKDVLMSQLTVREHLLLAAAVKGLPLRNGSGGGTCDAEARRIQRLIELASSSDGATLAANLSGGMKRKLQVGLALTGRPDVVVLDEPSSGMDPTARRGLWALVRQVKHVVTSHAAFLDYLKGACLAVRKPVERQ